MHRLIHADCFSWLREQPPNSIHAVCTDPPYGIVEFTSKELEKLRSGRGGIWRLPPKINGSQRAPLPRFTVLSKEQKGEIQKFFIQWGTEVNRVLVPGGHVVIAGNPMLAHYVQQAMTLAALEVRTTLIRIYQGFRGGDRPKNAEAEFPEVSVTPKSAYEPWMLFRKPISEKTVADNLRKWKTGGLRRPSKDKPFPEVIYSGKTPRREGEIIDHPCLKPQQFMRIIVRALLPLGEGIVVDTFMGGGSTIAAAQAVGYDAIGVEQDKSYYDQAVDAVPRLARLYPDFKGDVIDQPLPEMPLSRDSEGQLLFDGVV